MLLATLATAKAAKGARQVCEQKGKYFVFWSIENYCLYMCLNTCEGLSNKILELFHLLKGSLFEINFPVIILKKFKFLQMLIIGVHITLFIHNILVDGINLF